MILVNMGTKVVVSFETISLFRDLFNMGTPFRFLFVSLQHLFTEPNMIYDIPTLTSEAIGLLKSLIAIPSLSRDEESGCGLICRITSKCRAWQPDVKATMYGASARCST